MNFEEISKLNEDILNERSNVRHTEIKERENLHGNHHENRKWKRK